MNDKVLRQHIIDELDFEPSVDSAGVGVAVKDGIVTLSGHVPNYAQKSLAESAIKRIKGVRGIAEELQVDLGDANPYSDDDIAKRALTVIDLNVLLPAGKIMVQVERGWVTLSGEVDWDYQRTAALHDLRTLRGVMGISNNVTLKPQAQVQDVRRRIQDAMKRHAVSEADNIHITTEGSKVTLDGRVDSWSDRMAIEHAAWAVPGVRMVEDHVRVG